MYVSGTSAAKGCLVLPPSPRWRGLSKTLRRGCRSPACRTARWLCAGRVSPDRSATPTSARSVRPRGRWGSTRMGYRGRTRGSSSRRPISSPESRCSSSWPGSAMRLAGKLLRWVRDVENRPGQQSCLPGLNGIAGRFGSDASGSPPERGWATGYRAARAFREVIGVPRGEKFVSLSNIAGRLGSVGFTCAPGVTGIAALVCRRGDDVRIHVRERGDRDWARQAERFAFARAVGDVACFRDTPRSVVNGFASGGASSGGQGIRGGVSGSGRERARHGGQRL